MPTFSPKDAGTATHDTLQPTSCIKQQSVLKQGNRYSRCTIPFHPISIQTTGPNDINTRGDHFLRTTTRGILWFLAAFKWLGELSKPEHATKMVREAEITDHTGTINILAWDTHIQQIEDNEFYTVTNCKLKHCFG